MADVTAKIANVVDSRQLAFNAGSSAGIRIGTTARMYREIQITDPDTQEPLGSVLVPKLSLRVNFVEEKFCIAEVTDLVDTGGNPALSIFVERVRVTTNRGLARSDTVFVEIGEEATFHVE